MKRHSLMALAIVLLLVGITGCGEKEEAVKETDTTGLLAEQFEKSDIVRSSEVSLFEGESLYEHINGGAEVYHLYGFIEVATAYYKRGETEVLTDIYKFDNSDNAYGLYTTLRPENPSSHNLGVEGFSTSSSMAFVKGEYIVKITGYDETEGTSGVLSHLAKFLDGDIAGTTDYPDLFSKFPTEYLVPYSDKITAESFLGLRGADHVYSQKYAIDEDTLTFFLASDDAHKKLETIAAQLREGRESFSVSANLPFSDDQSMTSAYDLKTGVVDSYHGNIVVGPKSGFLAGVINLHDSETCKEQITDWLNSLP